MSNSRPKIDNIKIKGILSFGKEGIDLPLKDLNVFIGANASGKSNFFEVLNLIRSLPNGMQYYFQRYIDVLDFEHKHISNQIMAEIEISISGASNYSILVDEEIELLHTLSMHKSGAQISMFTEFLVGHRAGDRRELFRKDFFIESQIYERRQKAMIEVNVQDFESVVNQIQDERAYPEIYCLRQIYGSFRLYRDWSFGPRSSLKQPQRPDFLSVSLMEGFENLVLVLNNIKNKRGDDLRRSIKRLYESAIDIEIEIGGGLVLLNIVESGGVRIPHTRLSDGTIRYLALLAILLNPTPAPVTVIEEPELGLHPDIIPVIAELLVDASTRTQLFVSTHSRILVDALNDHPDSIVACEQRNGESHFHRLTKDDTQEWLHSYTLGQAWSRGYFGANRW